MREGSVNSKLPHYRIEIGKLQEEPVACRRLYGAIDIQPLEHMLHRANSLDATRGEAPTADDQ
jgi:hypothetical protein